MPLFTRFLARRAGPLGLAFTMYDVWRRIPPSQRKRLLEGARKHGPRLAANATKRRRGGPPTP